MRVDLHQHMWTELLVERLARRDTLPFVRRRAGARTVHAAGERPYELDRGDTPRRRAVTVRSSGLDRAVVALSSPLGIETLPRHEAAPLIAAHLEGIAALPQEFLGWGPVALDGLAAADVDAALDRGCVGISLPAPAMAQPERWPGLDRVLGHIAERGSPVLIHPGAASDPAREAGPDVPAWWRTVTDYVSQMHGAWLRFVTGVRPRHPDLRVVFAMLAGCAPLQAERVAVRGGPTVDLRDPFTFYDSSGYGPAALSAVGAVVGEDRLVYGSDRPMAVAPATRLDGPLQLRAGRFLDGTSAVSS